MTTLLEVRTTEQIEESNLRRLGQLNAQGIPLMGIDTHYLVELFNQMLTPAQVADARRKQEFWLEGELDRIESEIRQAVLKAPLQQGA